MARHRYGSVGVAMVCLTLAVPVRGQVDDRLEAYTGRNATGYLAPLVDAFRSNLNSGLFNTAHVPVSGFHVGVGFNVMSTFFGEDSRTFWATTESGFSPEMQARVPTVVGSTEPVTVEGDASTKYTFPGGFNVRNFYFACPQVTVGSWKGTEAVGRLVLFDTGISELGRLSVRGAGVRHNLSQYAARLNPVDLALAGYWQDADVHNEDGRKVINARLATVGVQSGMQAGSFYPYAGLSLNWWRMHLRYRFEDAGDAPPVDLKFVTSGDLQMTLGVSYRVGLLAAYGEYNFAEQSTVAAGLSVNFSNRSVRQ